MTAWATALAYLGAALLVRAPALLQTELNWDEALYWMIAGELRAGHAPYTATWDRKPPGLFALLAAVQAVGGDSMVALRLATTLGVAATALALRSIGRQLLPALPAAGTAAGFVYIAGSLRNSGEATNAELLLAPFAVAGLALALAAAREARPRPALLKALAAGALFGCATLIKQVALFDGLAAALMVAILPSLWGTGAAPRRRVALLAGMAVGGALPLLATIAAYAAIGQLDLLLANAQSAGRAGGAALNIGGMWVGIAMVRPLVVATMISLIALPLLRRRDLQATAAALAVVIWLACVAAVMLLLGRFADHMFVQALAPLALGTGCLLALAASLLPARASRPALGLALLALFAWGTLSPLSGGVETLWRRQMDGIAAWGDRTATLGMAIQGRIAGPGDVLVVGRTLGVYAATGTRPPTRFAFTGHLWDDYTPLENRVAEMERIMATRPRFVVVDDQWMPGGPRQGEMDTLVLARLAEILAEAYVRDGRVGRFISRGGGHVGGGTGAVVFRRADLPPRPPGAPRIQYDP